MKETKLFYVTPEACVVMLAINENVLQASAGASISDVEDVLNEYEY